LSDSISLRLPRDTVEKLDTLAMKENKDRSTLIRELLDSGIREKDISHAVERYRCGEISGWKAAQSGRISLWRFYEVLRERGVLVQYSEVDLEKDLRGLTEE
jgi:predicted DNA-binding protein